jgi:hypothetical protein
MLSLRMNDCDLLYVGATTRGLRRRVKEHLRGDGRVSSLRCTVGTLLASKLDLRGCWQPRQLHFPFGPGEDHLSRWLCENTLFSIQPMTNPLSAEKALIERLSTPFNITARRTHPYAKHLMEFKRQCRARSIRRVGGKRFRSGLEMPGQAD